jgi:C-terminal processing protease CtpA/Prc
MDPVDLEINDFIWSNLNKYYFWADLVSNLATDKFSSNSQYNQFLSQNPDHKSFFTSLLYGVNNVDKFSFITDDYRKLDNQLQGTTKSMGYFISLYIDNANEITGIIDYVFKGSPADKAGLTRGNAILSIDHQIITPNNYQSLFNRDSLTFMLGYISSDYMEHSLYKEVTIVAEELHESPIFLDTIYQINNKKIGYLIYNYFVPLYDNELNNIFMNYKDQGIQDLVLDLRYNSGGSVQSAVYLASMIYGTDSTKVLLNTKFNDNYENYLQKEYGSSYFQINFTDHIEQTPSIPLNSLGLKNIVILTSNSTAFASELLINGLRPYMNVYTIGTNTYGKLVGSIEIKDYSAQGVVNPNHFYAMVPVIYKFSNIAGFSEYADGLPANYVLPENPSNMQSLGNTNEPLLKSAISYLSGSLVKKSATDNEFNFFADSKDLLPFGKMMYFSQSKKR